MSARSVLCKIGAGPNAVSRNLPCGLQLNRIKRDLFGPVNSVETNKIFNEEIEKHQEKAIKKWGFDFRAGSPLSSNSQYIWERVPFQESTYTPEMYTLTRTAHVRPTAHIESNSFEDLLMDERAERENYIGTDSCDESQDDELSSPSVVVFKVPAIAVRSSSSGSNSSLKEATLTLSCVGCGKLERKRQPKITEYMKERKRLAQTPKKASPPAKRMRTNSNSSSASTSLYGKAGGTGSGGHITHNTHAHSISAHFSLRGRLHRNN